MQLALIDLIVESRQPFILGLTEHLLGQEVLEKMRVMADRASNRVSHDIDAGAESIIQWDTELSRAESLFSTLCESGLFCVLMSPNGICGLLTWKLQCRVYPKIN